MPIEKRKVLFVDDEPNVLQGLRRMLRSMRDQWDMSFAESGKDALDLLQTNNHDAIVSDMRMPGMDGAQLLLEVKSRHPQMVRIILSGQSEQEKILRSIGPTHRFLSKPCLPETLKQTLESACILHQTIQDPNLIRIISDLETLPSLSGIYEKVMAEMEDPSSSLEKIGKIISTDIGMTAKILHVANSAFYGQHHHVSNVEQAVMLLGMNTLRALVLHTQIFSTFDQKTVNNFSMDALWNHSITTASFARMIASEETKDQWIIEDSFASGLLHDVGELIFATNLPIKYDEALALARNEGLVRWEAEQRVLGTTHMEIGAHLLGLWGLPDSIIESLAFHHQPSRSGNQTFTPLTAVHIADSLDKDDQNETTINDHGQFDSVYLEQLGITKRIDQWCMA